MTNSRQTGVVEGFIWLVAALAASVLALGLFLLMAAVGAVLLLTGIAREAIRSVFGGSPRSRVTYQVRSPAPAARKGVIEGEVLRRHE